MSIKIKKMDENEIGLWTTKLRKDPIQKVELWTTLKKTIEFMANSFDLDKHTKEETLNKLYEFITTDSIDDIDIHAKRLKKANRKKAEKFVPMKDGEKIKKPPNAYQTFMSDYIRNNKSEFKGLKVTEIMSKVSPIWNKMKEDNTKEYKKYLKKYESEKREYEKLCNTQEQEAIERGEREEPKPKRKISGFAMLKKDPYFREKMNNYCINDKNYKKAFKKKEALKSKEIDMEDEDEVKEWKVEKATAISIWKKTKGRLEKEFCDNLSSSDKKKLEKLIKDDAKRYNKEMAQWTKRKEERAKRLAKSDNSDSNNENNDSDSDSDNENNDSDSDNENNDNNDNGSDSDSDSDNENNDNDSDSDSDDD